MNSKLKLGLLVFLIGWIGVFSTLAMDVPLPEEIQKEILKLFTPIQFKLLSLINPTMFLSVAVLVGTMLYREAGFELPLLQRLLGKSPAIDMRGVLVYGIVGGILSGFLIMVISLLFNPVLPQEFIELGDKFQPPIVMRLLYGGLTEEILIRFGVMTFIVWLLFKLKGKLSAWIYWAGIIISSIVFGIGHLPIVLTMISAPSTMLMLYIVLGNSIAGLVFGWLYWKKGLETAMMAHIFAHIVMLVSEQIMHI